tara:strand:- start:107 stop:631 length:525 start_codon:yes stop_codon:yes gene_type:complete
MNLLKKIGKKNICVIGLMGSGKSIIGSDLSKLYDVECYDSDKVIEKKCNSKINEIFKNNGEKYFRDIEEDVCLQLLNLENCVISLGGGAIISKKVRNFIKKYSFSIYLKVDINTLVKRLKNSKKRPLLQNTNNKKILEKLYSERKQYYNNADLIVENNYLKDDIIHLIKSKIDF